MDSLNTKQQQAVEAVLNGKNIFLTGPGGTGKSFTIKYIIELLKDKNYGLTATTGSVKNIFLPFNTASTACCCFVFKESI